MSKKILHNLDLQRNQLILPVAHVSAGYPTGGGVLGQFYFDSSSGYFGVCTTAHASTPTYTYFGTGSGTVTSVSVVNANGFHGSVATSTTTPAITITTTITGILQGNGTAISAATAGTHYTSPTGTESLTNKTIGGTNTIQANDSIFRIENNADGTKRAVFSSAGITTATTRTFTFPDVSGTFITSGNTTSITQTGTITTGVWRGTIVEAQYGGTGMNNSAANGIVLYTAGTGSIVLLDTDTSLAAGSDTRIPTQKAVKSYVDQINTADFNYAGAQDCSANPNYPTATKGDYWKVSVAGKIGGASGISVSAGDAFICNTTASSGNQATVGTSWDILQANVEQATDSTLGLIQLATVGEAEAKSDAVRAVTPAGLATFSRKASVDCDGDTSTTLTHNFGTRDVIVQVYRLGSTTGSFVQYEQVDTEIIYSTTNTVTVNFATAPSAAEYRIVAIG